MSQKESNLHLRSQAKFVILAMRKKKKKKKESIFLPCKLSLFDLEVIETNVEPHSYIIIK